MSIVATHIAARTKGYAGIARPRVRLDFKKNPYVAGDVIKLFKLMPGDIEQGCFADVVVAEGATATAKLGTFTTSNDAEIDEDGFATALDLNAVAFNKSTGALLHLSRGYAVEAYVGLTLAHDCDNALVDIELVHLPAAK